MNNLKYVARRAVLLVLILVVCACAFVGVPTTAHGDSAGDTVTVGVSGPTADGSSTWLLAAKVVTEDGTDGWTISKEAFEQLSLSYEAQEGGEYGAYLETITRPEDGVALGYDETTGQYWQIFVNGTASDMGASSIMPTDGTVIEWKYSAYGDAATDTAKITAAVQAEASTTTSTTSTGSNFPLGPVVMVVIVAAGVVCLLLVRKKQA